MGENELILKYKKEKDFKEIRLFGNQFFCRYKDKLKIIIDDKEIKLIEIYKMDDNSQIEELEIKLLGINNIIDASYMFQHCYDLTEIINLDKWEISY